MTMLSIINLIKNFDSRLSVLERQINKKRLSDNDAWMNVSNAMDSLITTLNDFVGSGKDDVESTKEFKSAFDYIHKKWLLRSSFASRSYLKPLGYPGDYVLMEKIYNNRPMGKGINKYIDRYFLNTDGCKMIRMRKNIIINIMKKLISEKGNNDSIIGILDLGAGSGRVASQFMNKLDCRLKSNVSMTLVDHDQSALENAKRSYFSNGLRANYIQENIVNLIRNKPVNNFQNQDIIISTGLFDYLSDRLFARGIKSLYKMLNQNGTIIVANLSKEFPNKFEMEWISRWPLIYRDKNDMLKLLEDANLDNYTSRFITDPQGMVVFCVVKKINKRPKEAGLS